MNTVCVSPARLLSAGQPALWTLEAENNINIVKRIRLQNGVNGFEKPEKKVDKLPFFDAEMPPDAKGIH